MMYGSHVLAWFNDAILYLLGDSEVAKCQI